MQDGQIVKRINRNALEVGNSASFSGARTPWMMIMINSICLAMILFALYRRRIQQG